jgi:hypothetical protein
MKPEDYANAGTEHAHQVALFMWASQNLDKYPELKWMYAIPNGGERNIAVAGRLKAEGVKSGVSDVCLPVARSVFHGLYIEMKKPGGKESAKQIEFGEFLRIGNYRYECCDHWEKARDVIINYLNSL